MNIAEYFPVAADEVTRVVNAADPSRGAAPTPCTEFDLRALVNHFVGTTAALAKVARRQALDPQDPYGSRRDPSKGDWQRELASNIGDLAAAWSTPQAWDGTVDMGGGESPATMIGEMALAEILLHGWDLARATGQQLTVPDVVATELLRSIEETAELGRQMGAYGPQVEVAENAGAFDRALAAAGRDPAWRASMSTSGAATSGA